MHRLFSNRAPVLFKLLMTKPCNTSVATTTGAATRHALRVLCGAALLAGLQPLAAAHSIPTAAVKPSVYRAAEAERQPLLDTLQQLVSIESGSRDYAGVRYIAEVTAARLKALGGDVHVMAPADPVRLSDTPEQIGPAVQAVFKGKGSARIMLIAHLDTVYLPGDLAQQPFRIEGGRAFGLGISDCKQGAALVLHTLAMLHKLGDRSYGQITVLFNTDEEISSPGSRALIAQLARDQDAVLSFENGGISSTLHLATSGIGAVYLDVEGKAAHAGAKPEAGVNALYELSHQLLQMRDLSKPELGLKLNWTLSQSGSNRNVIPAHASAQADVRALRVQDFESLKPTLERKTANKLLEGSTITTRFELRRPPLEASDAARHWAAKAQHIYQTELDLPLRINDKALGGGTDAAFAASQGSRAAVIEGLGLNGFGAHSNQDEYVLLGSIVPRLYLTTRLVMELAAARP